MSWLDASGWSETSTHKIKSRVSMMIWIIYLGIMDTLCRGKCSKSFLESFLFILVRLRKSNFHPNVFRKLLFNAAPSSDGKLSDFPFSTGSHSSDRKWNSGYQWQSTMALRNHSRQAAKGRIQISSVRQRRGSLVGISLFFTFSRREILLLCRVRTVELVENVKALR